HLSRLTSHVSPLISYFSLLTSHCSPDRLVQHDPRGGRQVETPHRPSHRNGEAALRMLLQDPRRHTFGLAAEYQAAVGLVRRVPERAFRIRGEVQAAVPADGIAKSK